MESKLFRLKRVKAQVWRFFPIFFLFLALILIALTVSENPIVSKIKQETLKVTAPVISVISQPVHWFRKGADGIESWIQTHQENVRLKEENIYLLKWRSLALQLSTELQELKEYLNYVPPAKTRHLIAKIVTDEGSAFTRSFVVSAGEKEGVKKGMLAFSPKGLFARVVEVMPHYSRVMALTDYMSRVPVWVGEKKQPALLIGDNTVRPFLQFLYEENTVQKGDVVMTSGYVGVYPAGLILGQVDDIQEEEVRVLPLENGESLLFVQLVDFSLDAPLLKGNE